MTNWFVAAGALVICLDRCLLINETYNSERCKNVEDEILGRHGIPGDVLFNHARTPVLRV